MIRYVLRRCAYSVLIMFGVLVLTFLLFRVAAGDPAATVLGKNLYASDGRVQICYDKRSIEKRCIGGGSK